MHVKSGSTSHAPSCIDDRDELPTSRSLLVRRAVSLGIHLKGRELQLGDLTKRWVSDVNGLSRSICKAVDMAIEAAAEQLARQGAPLTRTHQRQHAATNAASSIARSMAGVRSFRNDPKPDLLQEGKPRDMSHFACR